MAGVFTTLKQLKDGCLDALSSHFTRWTKPLRASLPLATLTDLGRSKSELIAENALLRQQLVILKRQVKLGIHVCKRTIQKYMRTVRTKTPRGQTWATDLEQPRRSGLGVRRAFRSPTSSFDRSQAFFVVERKAHGR
jgi:hypothetical protein